mmetsp:Transcript_12790/g.26117  ORF Transcript_12790/g.26117 Transcript_12790/m.26117 type:complete len:326 (-) Transcript_12790:161-1138(-)
MLVVLIGCLVVCTRAENDGAPADAKDPTAGGEIDGTEAEKLNYYELLEVEADIDPKALKKKYRKMALKSHPDKVSDPEEKKVAEKKFMELANAYDILSDVVTRTRYDFLLTQGIIEYEDRDWTEFDFRQGLDGKDPKYKKRAKFYHNFRDAQQRFDEIQKESDIPLVFALVGALGVGFIPIAMHWRQKSLAKSKRAAGMRDAAKNQASYNREYEKELAKYKAQLEAEAEDEDEDEDEEHQAEQAGGDGTDEATVKEQKADEAGGAAPSENDEPVCPEVEKPAKKSQGKFECRLCRKSYKSEKQLQNHFSSKAHIKNEKKAAKNKK